MGGNIDFSISLFSEKDPCTCDRPQHRRNSSSAAYLSYFRTGIRWSRGVSCGTLEALRVLGASRKIVPQNNRGNGATFK